MRLLQLGAALALPSTTSLHSVGSEVTQWQGWGERRTLACLGVSRELWWGLPPQDSDDVEDAISCWVVGLVDGECLLGQVFVFVGVFLLRNETPGSHSTCQPPGLTLSHLHTFAGAVSPHLGLLWPPVSPPHHEAVESDSDLLPRQCPPPACLLLGPQVLQDVLPGDDVLSAQLLGIGCLWAQGDRVPRGPGTGGPLHATLLELQRG